MSGAGRYAEDVTMLQFAPRHDVETIDTEPESFCRRHVLEPTYGHCSSCGDAYCDQCLVELPTHGVMCTGCALAYAGVRRPARSRRGFFRR